MINSYLRLPVKLKAIQVFLIHHSTSTMLNFISHLMASDIIAELVFLAKID